MSKQEDDTTEQNEPSGEEREPQPRSYYYDDSTGYEIYDPEKDEDEDEDLQGQRTSPLPAWFR